MTAWTADLHTRMTYQVWQEAPLPLHEKKQKTKQNRTYTRTLTLAT